MENYIIDVLENEKLSSCVKRIYLLAELENETPEEIINKVTISSISKKFKPRFKDFSFYLESGLKVSGISIRNLEKGKKAWKDGTHKMKDNLFELVETYGEDVINKQVLLTALQLVKISIDNVYLEDNKRKKEQLNMLVQNLNFLYVMLQVAVRLIGIDLYKKGVKFHNKTLGFMTKMMEQDKKKIGKLFSKAMTSKKEEDINEAISRYYDMINEYIEDFKEREFRGNGNDALEIGGEQKLVDQFGEENIHFFIGILLGKLRNDLIKDNYILDYSNSDNNETILLK